MCTFWARFEIIKYMDIEVNYAVDIYEVIQYGELIILYF
jgi:hypothetical protein